MGLDCSKNSIIVQWNSLSSFVEDGKQFCEIILFKSCPLKESSGHSVHLKIIILIPHAATPYVVVTQKNRLDERVLLSTQNTCLN